MDRDARAIVCVREAIERLQFTGVPVTAILSVAFKTEFAGDVVSPDEQKRLRGNLHQALTDTLLERINEPITVMGHAVRFCYTPAFPSATTFWTTSGYLDWIKAAGMKAAIEELNHAWQAQLLANGGASITLQSQMYPGPWRSISANFLLANPLECIPLAQPEERVSLV